MIDLGFRSRDWQARCFRSLKRFSILVVHRRGGKTVLAIMRLIDAALRLDRPMGRYGYLAPQLKQAKRISWKYLVQYAMKVPGTIKNETELWVQFPNGARIQVFGADQPDSIRGDYFDGCVIDEVKDIKRELWGSVVRPMLADRKGWALFIGTPQGINLLSEIYFAALADEDWYAQILTCYDTDALDPDEIESIKNDPTTTPLQFRQEMLCDFTASNANTLISIEEARAATQRKLEPRLYQFAPRILGVDVAWEGGDRCAIFRRQGLMSFAPLVIPGLPEKTFATTVANEIEAFQPHMTYVDTTGGYGGETVSRLHDLGYKKLVRGVVFSWAASNERYSRLRDEMWFKMADWIKEGGCLPNRSDLISELCAPTYSNDNASNRMKLESKADIRERLGVSPDIADALALTFAFPVMPPREKKSEPQYAGSAWS